MPPPTKTPPLKAPSPSKENPPSQQFQFRVPPCPPSKMTTFAPIVVKLDTADGTGKAAPAKMERGKGKDNTPASSLPEKGGKGKGGDRAPYQSGTDMYFQQQNQAKAVSSVPITPAQVPPVQGLATTPQK